MKVYLVREDCYDMDSTYTQIIGAFSSEEKAEAYRRQKENVNIQCRKRLEACRKCALMRDLTDYLEMCDDHNIKVQEAVIDKRTRRYQKNAECHCEIEKMTIADGEIYDVHCVGYERLYWICQRTNVYSVICMEIQQ